MKKIYIALILVALAGGGVYWWSASGTDIDSATAMNERPPQGVATLILKREVISLPHQLPGRISPFRQSQVRPQVDGIITERLFEEGADVEKGQQLYKIDDARYKAALNSALADLQSVKANIKTVEARTKRYKELVKINAVSQQEYDDAKAELDQANAAVAVAQAAVDLAQVNLDYTKVYAPISGRISRSYVTEGTLVTANQSQNLATITQLNPVYVDMQLSGTDAIQLRSRMTGKDSAPVHLILNESTQEMYPEAGTLKFSEVTVDEGTGAITLRALIPNDQTILLPGLFVRANLDLGKNDVLMVPQRATTRMPDGSLTVWIVDDTNHAQQRNIQVEQAHKDHWIVTSGLSADDQVIVTGYQKIGAGAPVSPTPWKNTETTPNTSSEKE